jgi:hypothetical protein
MAISVAFFAPFEPWDRGQLLGARGRTRFLILSLLLKSAAHLTTIPCMSSKWRRVLWQKQPYPDNYVPDEFLSALLTNCEQIIVTAAYEPRAEPGWY